MCQAELYGDHLDRMRDIIGSSIHPGDISRRIVRENIRYERGLAALRSYYLDIEEWEEEGMM
jgi:hypothetical protein